MQAHVVMRKIRLGLVHAIRRGVLDCYLERLFGLAIRQNAFPARSLQRKQARRSAVDCAGIQARNRKPVAPRDEPGELVRTGEAETLQNRGETFTRSLAPELFSARELLRRDRAPFDKSAAEPERIVLLRLAFRRVLCGLGHGIRAPLPPREK